MNNKQNLPPLVFGEVLFDQFPDGSVILGGAPFNVAWHLQAFGLAPVLISRVGDDPLGRQIRGAMKDWGMSTAGLQLDSAHPTGTVQVSLNDGEPSFDIVKDRAYDFIEANALPPVDTVSVLYHGSLALRNTESRSTLDWLKARVSAPLFVDVNLRPPWWNRETVLALLEDADWVKLNEDELASLLPDNPDKSSQAKQLLEDYALKVLCLTRGRHGALIMTSDGERHPVEPQGNLKVADTVGAGDAFAATLLLGLSKQWPLDVTVQRAQAFASAICGVRGATVSDPGFYAGFKNSWSTE